jgi:hypothetical protein
MRCPQVSPSTLFLLEGGGPRSMLRMLCALCASRTLRCAAQVSPSTLFLLEGGGQLGLAMNWGDGYVTDSSLIRAAGLSDPNHFFQQLLKKPYLANVVIAPHYYPPSVSTASTK